MLDVVLDRKKVYAGVAAVIDEHALAIFRIAD